MFVNQPHPGFRRSGMLGETGEEYQPFVGPNGETAGPPPAAPESKVPGAHLIDNGATTNDGTPVLTWVDAHDNRIELPPPPGVLTVIGESIGTDDRYPIWGYVDESPLLPVASYAPAPVASYAPVLPSPAPVPTSPAYAPTQAAPSPMADSGSQGASIIAAINTPAPAPYSPTVTVPAGAGGSQQAIPVVLVPAAATPSPGSLSPVDTGATPSWFIDGGGNAGGVPVGSAPAPAAAGSGKWLLAALAALLTLGN